jgi:hypothetical protein
MIRCTARLVTLASFLLASTDSAGGERTAPRSSDGAMSIATGTHSVLQRTTYAATRTANADCAALYYDDSDPDNSYLLFLTPRGKQLTNVATAPDRVAGYERRTSGMSIYRHGSPGCRSWA